MSKRIDLQKILDAAGAPPLFEPGDRPIWTDPHIARQLLAVHLNPDTHAASRPPDEIEATIEWLMAGVGLKPGDMVLDMGCGPGLYAVRLAERGVHVTGVDFSQVSLDHARQQAVERNLPIVYVYDDFTRIDYDRCFDMVLQIYGEMNTFSPDVRDGVLRRVHRALKPGGCFVFDVSTPVHRLRNQTPNRWTAQTAGFWHGRPHVVLEQGFDYDHRIHVDQYVVITDNGEVTVFRNWFQDHTVETIAGVLIAHQFEIASVYGNLQGGALDDDSEWIGVVARKKK